MNLELVQNFLETRLTAPLPRLIFLQDPSQLLSGITELLLHGQLVRTVYYQNDLQFRLELEWSKDDHGSEPVCMISQKEDAENTIILDYLVRSQVIAITPQQMLNFVSKGHWGESANWLKGEDFWRTFDVLAQIKDKPHLTTLDSDPIYLISALLNTDFTRRLDPVQGFIFYFKKMMTPRYQQFQQNYPHLAQLVENKIFKDVPQLKALSENQGLLDQFWISPTEKTSIAPDESLDTTELKHQIAIKAPHLVRDQLEQAENRYFSPPEQVEQFLKDRLISDNWSGWLDYLQSENFLFEPLRHIIQKVILHVMRDWNLVDFSALKSAAERLSEHFLLKSGSDFQKNPKTDFVHFFQSIILLYEHLQKIKRSFANGLPAVGQIIRHIYPNDMAPLPMLLDSLALLQQQQPVLPENVFKKVQQDVYQIQNEVHHFWVNWVNQTYQFSIEKLQTWNQPTQYPFVYLRTTSINPPVFILLFDGMRWDGWKYLEPLFRTLFPTQELNAAPLLMPLPTTTEFGRPFLLSGQFLPKDDGSALANAIGYEACEIYYHTNSTEARRQFEHLLASEVPLKILNFPLFDLRIHHASLSLSLVYQEIQAEFEQTVAPLLKRLPPAALKIICSDHGFLQVQGKLALEKAAPSENSNRHRRFILSDTSHPDTKNFVFFDWKRLGLKKSTQPGLAFLKTAKVIQFNQPEAYTRYAHGGISLEEMVVPVVYVNAECGLRNAE